MCVLHLCSMFLDVYYVPCRSYLSPPAPMNHEKTFKGLPPQDAPSKLVQLWYKKFPPDQRGQVEMKKTN